MKYICSAKLAGKCDGEEGCRHDEPHDHLGAVCNNMCFHDSTCIPCIQNKIEGE